MHKKKEFFYNQWHSLINLQPLLRLTQRNGYLPYLSLCLLLSLCAAGRGLQEGLFNNKFVNNLQHFQVRFYHDGGSLWIGAILFWFYNISWLSTPEGWKWNGQEIAIWPVWFLHSAFSAFPYYTALYYTCFFIYIHSFFAILLFLTLSFQSKGRKVSLWPDFQANKFLYTVLCWRAGVCSPLLCLCRPFMILMDVWIRTQSAAVASGRVTNFATHPLT